MVAVRAAITCPDCATTVLETMPTDSCLHFYICQACGATLQPKPGDCCVFCSYADIRCPPMQSEEP